MRWVAPIENDAAEHKYVVLDLIFLKYISCAFEELHGKPEGEKKQGVDAVDPDGVHGAVH
jgi:type I restriction enzyme M protein